MMPWTLPGYCRRTDSILWLCDLSSTVSVIKEHVAVRAGHELALQLLPELAWGKATRFEKVLRVIVREPG